MSERGAQSEGSGGDAELLDALAEGREAAFEIVYERYAAGLLSAARAACFSHAVAEDAVQEAFVGLVRRGARVREIHNLRAYLFTAAVRAARRVPRETSTVRLGADLSAEVIAPPRESTRENSASGDLERALERLPQEQREVVALHIDGGMTFEEISAALEISAATVASRYRYALEKLRAGLAHVAPMARKAGTP